MGRLNRTTSSPLRKTAAPSSQRRRRSDGSDSDALVAVNRWRKHAKMIGPPAPRPARRSVASPGSPKPSGAAPERHAVSSPLPSPAEMSLPLREREIATPIRGQALAGGRPSSAPRYSPSWRPSTPPPRAGNRHLEAGASAAQRTRGAVRVGRRARAGEGPGSSGRGSRRLAWRARLRRGRARRCGRARRMPGRGRDTSRRAGVRGRAVGGTPGNRRETPRSPRALPPSILVSSLPRASTAFCRAGVVAGSPLRARASALRR